MMSMVDSVLITVAITLVGIFGPVVIVAIIHYLVRLVSHILGSRNEYADYAYRKSLTRVTFSILHDPARNKGHHFTMDGQDNCVVKCTVCGSHFIATFDDFHDVYTMREVHLRIDPFVKVFNKCPSM